MHGLFHFAYLDAGTGSLIIQSVIGAMAGVAVFGRRVFAKVAHSVLKRGDTTTNSKPSTSATSKKPAADKSK